MTQSAVRALTYLFVPGNRPERFDKALASDADRIILDLEDAVSPDDKALARQAVANWLASGHAGKSRVLVRINDVTTPWFAQDVDMLSRSQPCGAMLSKCESADPLNLLRGAMSSAAELVALVETAKGIAQAQPIAWCASVSRLALGALDLMVDLSVPAHSATLAYAASQLVIASRAAGLPQPIAGVTPALDAQQVAADMQSALALGFGAKMCIHPMQIAAVRRAMQPSSEELDWAQRVLHAWAASESSGASAGVIQVDGKMVDLPVVTRAESVLARASS